MILFFHGLDSSCETNKFTQIHTPKICETVSYRDNSIEEISQIYNDLIDECDPDFLMGHSLGGYWALKLSHERNIPCIVINPALQPSLEEYSPLPDEYFLNGIKKYAYLELGDEVIDMNAVNDKLKDCAYVITAKGGNHRVVNIEMVNKIIDLAINYQGVIHVDV